MKTLFSRKNNNKKANKQVKIEALNNEQLLKVNGGAAEKTSGHAAFAVGGMAGR